MGQKSRKSTVDADEITVVDDALTRPWTALKYYHPRVSVG